MLRSPSLSTRDNCDLSSPDPLAASSDGEYTIGNLASASRQSSPKRKPAPIAKSPRKSSKPLSQTRTFEPLSSSPFRSVAEQNLSPWKIRVTVEAEPEDSEMEGAATRTMTRTMRIPLRQDSSPTEATKGYARGRVSSPSTSTRSKRSSTPVRSGRNSSRSRRPSVTDLDARPLGDDEEEDDWLKQKKSPRKRKSSRGRKATSGSQSGRTTRASNVEIRPDTDAESEAGAVEQKFAVQEADMPGLRTIDLNRVSVRPRAVSTKSQAADEAGVQELDDHVHDKPAMVAARKSVEQRKVSANSAMSYPTPSPTSSYHGDSDGAEKAIGEPGPAFENVGFDTILESEGFTMIDLGTIPSARQYLSSPLEEGAVNNLQPSRPSGEVSEKTEVELQSSQPSARTSSVTNTEPDADDTELSSTVPSSPPVGENTVSLLHVPSSSSSRGMVRKVTPQPYSSPKLPSPPRQTLRRSPPHQHRGSSGAVHAGIALQEAVSPGRPSESASLPEKQQLSPQSLQSNSDKPLFEGFDSGTKRELRAGLRFGEELAKQRSSSPPAQSNLHTSSDTKSKPDRHESGVAKKPRAVTSHPPETTVWRGEHLVQRTPVQISTGAAAPTGIKSLDTTIQTPQNSTSKMRNPSILDTQARREREWQLEREAVSRQIQNANESQVIVIDSDSEYELPQDRQGESGADAEDEYHDDEDIWLQEAKNSSSPPAGVKPAEEIQQRDPVIVEAKNRHRRRMIPSPWKRGDEIDHDPPVEQSTFLSTKTEEMSGLMFWKEPESKVKFGAGEIQRQRLRQRSTSGTFDIDLMAGTPRKETVEDEQATEMTDPQHYEESVALEEESQDEETIERTPQGNQEKALDSSMAADSEIISSPLQPVNVAVNFNDSSIATSPTPAPTTPPSQDQGQQPTAPAEVSSPPRPPTPRSALKGSRYALDQQSRMGLDTPAVVRRVIFSQRSRGVDIDGLESSFSMKTASERGDDDDVGTFAADVGMQLNWELQIAENEEEDGSDESTDPSIEVEVASERRQESIPARMDGADDQEVTPQSANATKGWGGWLWGSSKKAQQEPVLSSTETRPLKSNSDDMNARSRTSTTWNDQQGPSDDQKWERTKSSIPSSSNRRTSTKKTSKAAPLSLPSYLLPPSYPSDPVRSAAATKSSSRPPPLSLRGEFTNTHFRTLHIIYRKSLRPKFHAPSRATIRPEIKALRGTEMVIDESPNGVDEGEFVFTFSDTECAVLERFMQELEFGYGWWDGRWVSDGRGDDESAPRWGWSVDQLATWLCRIVVGEVVREEERNAKGRRGAKVKV